MRWEDEEKRKRMKRAERGGGGWGGVGEVGEVGLGSSLSISFLFVNGKEEDHFLEVESEWRSNDVVPFLVWSSARKTVNPRAE